MVDVVDEGTVVDTAMVVVVESVAVVVDGSLVEVVESDPVGAHPPPSTPNKPTTTHMRAVFVTWSVATASSS
ncbi:MAG TPA: hypothetical protein VLA91_15075 [Acidimicrobiia bacterium]|nr:hypothetical protein [Acidimicrobiia bacterium]